MFNCTECKYTTKSEFYLHRHIKKHSAQVLYCDQCDYSTQVKELFKVHQNKHTGVTFKCSFCQFESHSKFNLGQHVKKVHPEGADTAQQQLQQNLNNRASSHHLVQPQPHHHTPSVKPELTTSNQW